MISLFKMAPALVWKCCLVFLCARISKVPSGENPCDELHSYVSYSVVGHEFNVTNQQHILSEASLDRNVYKTCDSDVITRGRIEPNPVFPLGATVHYSIIQHSRSLYRTQLLQRREGIVSLSEELGIYYQKQKSSVSQIDERSARTVPGIGQS